MMPRDRALLRINSALTRAARRVPPPQEAASMSTMRIDPWPVIDAARHEPDRHAAADDPRLAPAGWERLSAATRARVAGVALEVLARHPDRRDPADSLWLAHRCLEVARRDREVETDLFAHAAIGNPVLLLVDLVRKLRRAHSVVAALDDRILALQRERATLARLLAAPGGPTAPDAAP
jgi:hypothetical protein